MAVPLLAFAKSFIQYLAGSDEPTANQPQLDPSALGRRGKAQ